jgi:hypothetical protein
MPRLRGHLGFKVSLRALSDSSETTPTAWLPNRVALPNRSVFYGISLPSPGCSAGTVALGAVHLRCST